MRNYSGIILAFLAIVVIFTAGCTNQTAPEASVPVPTLTTPVPTLTTLPVITTPAIPTPPSTGATTPAVPITPTVIPVTPLLPEADPTDMSAITFEFYYDNDFSVEYPSTWTIETLIYVPYPVGPLYVSNDPRFNTQYRVVTFTSPDQSKKFVALTQDFERAGAFSLNPTIEWTRRMFQRDYPDLSAATYLGNYKYFAIGTAMASTYDVTLPEGTHYYPSAYTIETIVSQLHAYNFGFFTDTANFTKYRNLKEIMISSVKTPDTEIHSVSTVGNSTTIL
jgi:hypothetical protein